MEVNYPNRNDPAGNWRKKEDEPGDPPSAEESIN